MIDIQRNDIKRLNYDDVCYVNHDIIFIINII
jgi:hypothetical protein